MISGAICKSGAPIPTHGCWGSVLSLGVCIAMKAWRIESLCCRHACTLSWWLDYDYDYSVFCIFCIVFFVFFVYISTKGSNTVTVDFVK